MSVYAEDVLKLNRELLAAARRAEYPGCAHCGGVRLDWRKCYCSRECEVADRFEEDDESEDR